jgi:hypothetical protein
VEERRFERRVKRTEAARALSFAEKLDSPVSGVKALTENTDFIAALAALRPKREVFSKRSRPRGRVAGVRWNLPDGRLQDCNLENCGEEIA